MSLGKKEETKLYLKNLVGNIPCNPGSYQFYDENHKIIYVGKAKNLKNRVSSYFRKEVNSYKTKVLVRNISDITYTIVNSEEDALLLENSLIKKYKPKYNVLLKDGKTYPSICITKECFPKIFNTRTINKKTGVYFGPYPHIQTMHTLLDLIRKVYKPRTCNLPLTEKSIREERFKPCLEFHVENCKAPCIARQSREEYIDNINQAKEILKGNTRDICNIVHEKMLAKAKELKFEEAEELKKMYLLLNDFIAKSEIVSRTITDVDVFTITDNDSKNIAFINYIHVKNGTINQSFTFEYKRKLDETFEELLISAIPEIRNRFQSQAKEILVPFKIDWKIKDAEFFIPQRGEKKHLLDLSEMNVKQYKFDRLKQAEKLNPEQRQTRLMKELQEKLKLESLPYHIECFDNSNISGTDAVAACVVFKSMKPSKNDYRKYNIKTVAGPNDYASMQEIVRRRYTRMQEEGKKLPNLIITDGGKGQMESVRKVIEDELHLNIPIAGLAKNEHHRTNELLFGFPPRVIGLKPNSELFKVLTKMQDEVHRFAISFHRDKRSKHALHSSLDNIKGIGPKSKELLFKSFKSIKRIKEADLDTLSAVLGSAKGTIIYEYFQQQKH